MDSSTAMSKSRLGESFGHSGHGCSFRPTVSVAMQGNPVDAKSRTALLELCRPVAFPNRRKVRKQKTRLRQAHQHCGAFGAESNMADGFRLQPDKRYGASLPIDVFRLKQSDVRVAAAKEPAKLVIGSTLRIGFTG